MSNFYIVVDDQSVWAPYYPTEQLISAQEYLEDNQFIDKSCQVYNLCTDYSYGSKGYYCSLLAQARGHRVIPSVKTITLLTSELLLRLDQELLKRCSRYLDEALAPGKDSTGATRFYCNIYFGATRHSGLQRLARILFEKYPAPILTVTFERNDHWQIVTIAYGSLASLDNEEQTQFAEALDGFSKKVWRKPRNTKPGRYDLAILVDPDEKMPPSNKGALKHFIRQAKQLGIEADLLTPEDIGRLLEYDALFIRMTTALDNDSYKFARLAESNNMPVIDDTEAMIKCTNKVFLNELFLANKIPVPPSKLIYAAQPPTFEELAEQLGSPIILKIPDGSFSVGIVKAKDQTSYREATQKLFAMSSVLLAQTYIPTDFDWRIGVLNGRALYACKYLMARGHWQIYKHGESGVSSGGFETLPVHQVPRDVVKTALKAAALIGNSLYGVDIKETEEGPVVIEVNDNPSIDKGVEDAHLGDDLYWMIMEEFNRRLESRRRGY